MICLAKTLSLLQMKLNNKMKTLLIIQNRQPMMILILIKIINHFLKGVTYNFHRIINKIFPFKSGKSLNI